MTQYDPRAVDTEQLKRSYHFHMNDAGTMTMEEECRRMRLLQEIGRELKRREEPLLQ